MSDNAKVVYKMCPLIEAAYVATNQWLVTLSKAHKYTELKYDEVTQLLKKQTLQSAAAQYHTYFPTHYFKVLHMLSEVLGREKLVEWLNYNPRMCVIDIGCGAGAGSAALIESIIQLRIDGHIKRPIELYCLGIDPNVYAIALYDKFLNEVKSRLSPSELVLEWDKKPEGIPAATSWLIHNLEQKRSDWSVPHLAQAIIMQVNIVSPLDEDYQDQDAKYKVLASLGVRVNKATDTHSQFGKEQALAYKAIFEGVSIDHMHVTTIGTDNYWLSRRVKEMGIALGQVFNDSRHQVMSLGEGEHQICFINPETSRFAWNKKLYTAPPFNINAVSITNQELRGDREWHEVIDLDNLQLAWVRARHTLVEDSFVDELEVRLFEKNLNVNLERMRQQLMAYADEVARVDDYVAYKIPKSSSSTRPRGLSTIEEEVLAVAIIQKLGNKESQLRQCSYAYRIVQKSRGRDTEYLYEPWFGAYKKYIGDAREAAQKDTAGAVIRADIKSFYTRIEQSKLISLVTENLLDTKSRRVEWLIKLLLSKDLDEHEVGRGIVQGNIGSGFYANIYLTEVDMLFGANNEWGVQFYRFVDDMIFVIPKSEEGQYIEDTVDEVMSALVKVLDVLRLKLNNDKTEIYYDVGEFIQATTHDDLLEQISDSYNQLTSRLWILNKNCRDLFIDCIDNDELWWHRIDLYRRCLREIGIYVTSSFLSRWIHRYLFNSRRRHKDLKGKGELIITFPGGNADTDLAAWKNNFEQQNSGWLTQKQNIHAQVLDLLVQSWQKLQENNLSPTEQRGLETRVRFAINKLATLGFAVGIQTVIEILLYSSWITKEPSRVLENLAQQGYANDLLEILNHYQDNSLEMNEYLRAVTLRAIRFLFNADSRHWEAIIHHSVQGELAERLMATETWLLMSDLPAFWNYESHIEDIKNALQDTSLPIRLRKNYLLLMGQYDSKKLPDFSALELSIEQAYEVSHSGEVSELLGYIEPSLIRANYYSGKQAGDSDHEYPS